MRLRPLKLFFASTGLLFLVFVVSIAIARSYTDPIAPASQVAVDFREEQTEADRLSGQDGSELQLRDFRRVGVKDGRKLWEVVAKDARYFAGEEVTQVNDISAIVHREDNSEIQLEAKAARLQLGPSSFGKAEFEGNLRVQVDKRLTLFADAATYADRLVRVPGDVRIEGEGFLVEGKGLDMHVDEERILLKKDVRSRFESGAKIPKVKR